MRLLEKIITSKLSLSLLILISAIFISNNITAQITINENIITDNFSIEYKIVLYETVFNINPELVEILTGVGDNQTWDFRDLNYVDSTIIIEKVMPVDPADPYLNDPNLANSDFIIMNTLPPVQGGLPDTTFSYRYHSLENGNMIANGAITIVDLEDDGVVDTLLQWFSPAKLILPFPITVNSIWDDSTSILQTFVGMTFTSSIMIDSSEVKGWGTLHTPANSGQALRVNSKNITSVPNTPISTLSTNVDFATEDNSFSASIVLEDGRAFYTTRERTDGTSSIAKIPVFDFRLQQNYPNPFLGNTRIEFSLDKKQDVNIRVLDINGKAIQLLTSQQYTSGNHYLDWNAEHCPAGMYILEMRVGNQIQHRVMSIVK